MKSFIFSLLLPLLTDGAAVDPEKRQILGGPVPKLKALKIEDLPSKTGVAGAKRVKITYGPYKIKGTKSSSSSGNAKSMDSGGSSFANDIDDDFPRDITIMRSSTDVVNKDGKRLELKDGIYNHHTGFFDLTRMNPSPFGCANGKWGFNLGSIPVIAAGATERAVQVFMAESGDVKSGYYLPKTGSVKNLIDLVNYNEQDQEVFTSTELEYMPGKPAGFRNAYMTLVDPGLCGGPNGAAIRPPKGVNKFSINSTDIIMTKSGYFVYTVGHMHDGGVNVILKINDELKCNSKALYGGDQHTTIVDGKKWETIRETTPCTGAIRVEKGSKIYMQADYDVELHPSREMGGHGHGMGGKGMKTVAKGQSASKLMDGGAEQMALFVAYFSPDP